MATTSPTTARASPILIGLTLIITFFILFPIGLTIMAGLVNNYREGLASGLTLRWIGEVWSAYGNTVTASLIVATLSVLAAVLIGVPCAYALARSRSRLAAVFEEIITLPIAVPGLATALALLLTYGSLQGFRQSYGIIVVGHVLFTLPFMIRTVSAAFQRPELLELDEAARTLGADFPQRFLGILAPAVLPSIVAGALMVFTLSIGEFNITWMLQTPLTRTLPVGLADNYLSARIEVGSAYTIIFLLVILPVLWGLQAAVKLLERMYEN